jgi:hypothetical protein
MRYSPRIVYMRLWNSEYNSMGRTTSLSKMQHLEEETASSVRLDLQKCLERLINEKIIEVDHNSSRSRLYITVDFTMTQETNDEPQQT